MFNQTRRWYAFNIRVLLVFCFIALSIVPCPGIELADEIDDANEKEQQLKFFHEQVEPILARHCYDCHSHRSQSIESGLALDWRSGWESGGARGKAIVPSKPEESLLIRAVQHQDAKLKMPEEKLADSEIELLIRWVQGGAYDDRVSEPSPGEPRDWWSLKPLDQPPIPTVKNADESNNPIDAFVSAKLQQAGLSHSPAASPREIVRRLYLDLIGLPPTIEDVAAFEQDPSDAAYEAMVDRLLASERYGERWARHWMDTIHFAESHGYEHDVGRDHAWPYRDYLIRSLNADKDWATLIREQLAVDYYKPDATDLLPALGFLGAGTFDLSTYSTGPVTFDYIDRDDMVTQTMAAFVSTTANCARCHAHKFDPITQEDYYSLQAVFSGVLKGDVGYDADSTVADERRRLNGLLDAARRHDKSILQSDPAQHMVAEWLQSHRDPATWTELRPVSFVSSDGATLTRDDNGVIVASGANPETDIYTLTGQTGLKKITALQLELFPHDSLPMKGPGRCQNGNLHLSEVAITVFSAGKNSGEPLKIARASADFNQEGWGIDRAIDGNAKTAWGIFPEVGKPHQAVFELAEPISLAPDATITVTLKQLHGGSHLIGAFRVALTDAPLTSVAIMPADVRAALAIEETQRTESVNLLLDAHAVTEVASGQLQRLPEQSQVYAVGKSIQIPAGNGKYQAGAIAAPKKVHLLQRGQIDKPKQEISPGALAVLDHARQSFSASESMTEPMRRAALAEWLAHRDNVLTWRSVVNRVWHYHFGRGLCDTPSDFGRMGGVPSHPELIDWLAVWFRDSAAGSMKQLHRLIVTSRTYRQASATRDEPASIDSENRLLWRQNSHRLDADAFRDFVLSVSGKIDFTMYGPSVQHFKQSPGPQSTPNLDYVSYDWSALGSSRRSIYRYVWRGIPDPLMAALDFPDLGLLSPVRSESASPLQALALMNNSFVLHFGQAMADDVVKIEADPAMQVKIVVQRCWLREPTADELKTMTTHVGKYGLASLCRVLMNSSEFLMVQ